MRFCDPRVCEADRHGFGPAWSPDQSGRNMGLDHPSVWNTRHPALRGRIVLWAAQNKEQSGGKGQEEYQVYDGDSPLKGRPLSERKLRHSLNNPMARDRIREDPDNA